MPNPEREPVQTWQAVADRESLRFREGVYTTVPWATESWNINSGYSTKHFAHVSEITDDSGNSKCLVAYTPDERKGFADIQIATKPRRYLVQFFGKIWKDTQGMSDAEVDKYADQLASKLEFQMLKVDVLLAYNQDHIRWVFEHSNRPNEYSDSSSVIQKLMAGCPTCMSHQGDEYSTSGIHPTEVYGYGDLAVAHLIDKSSNEMIVKARELVWPDKKIRSHATKGTYGWETKLDGGLALLGYKRGDFDGARILHLKNKSDKTILPYFDIPASADGTNKPDAIGRKYLVLVDGESGEYLASLTNGLAANQRDEFECHECGEYYYEDDTDRIYVEDAGDVCQGCYDEYYFSCECCEEQGHRDSSHEVDDEMWCNYCADNDASYCGQCSTYTRHNNIVGEYEGEQMCDSCYDGGDYHLKECGTIVEPTEIKLTVARCDCCDDKELEREDI
jgi:hypothetical protein